MTKGKRRSVSMREELYFALKLYAERLNAGVPESMQSTVTTVNGQILRSEIQPIPRGLIEEGGELAKRATKLGYVNDRFELSRAFVRDSPSSATPERQKPRLSGGEPVDAFEEKPPKSGEEFYSGVMKF